MKCEKTGAVIWLDEYDVYAVCDAFVMGSIYVFRVSGKSDIVPKGRDTVHYTVRQSDHWFDQMSSQLNGTVSTLLCHGQNVVFHGTDGVKEGYR